MANFTNVQITSRGRALQAKAQAGAALVFTRFRIGSGTMSGQQIADMTNLIQPVMWLTLNKSQASGSGQHTLGAPFTNADVTTGFYFREWGVFAQDPDIGEIMYCYGNVGASAEYIPAGGGSEIVEQQLDMITLIGNATNVSATIDTSLAFVSIDMLNGHKNAAVLDHPDSSVTTSKIAPKAVTAVKIADNTVGSGQLAASAATDTVIGDRTISDVSAPTGDTAKPTTLFGWLANMIKSITGKSSWRTTPSRTLEDLNSHIGSGDIAHAVVVANGSAGFMSGADKAAHDKSVISLSAAPATPVTIPQGVSIVNADRKSRFKDMQISGRTLVNIPGRDGNCESLTPFTTSGTVALSTTQKKSGINSIKTTATGAESYFFKDYSYPLDKTKQYVLAGWIFLESWSAGLPKIRLTDVGTLSAKYDAPANTATVGSWQFVYVKIPVSNTLVGNGFRIVAGGPTNGVLYFDELRLYEVSTADSNAIGTTYKTGAKIDQFIPYVDDMKHVNAVYVQNSGKNLLPPFSEWRFHANASAVEPYKLTLNATAIGQSTEYTFSVIPGQTYALSYTSSYPANAYMNIAWLDKSGGVIGYSPQNENGQTVTSPINAVSGTMLATNLVPGTFTFTNPMLNIGDTALPFEPSKPSYVFLPDCNLRSNVDRSIADRLYMDGEGKPRAIRRFKEMALDGSLGWVYSPITISGSKRVEFAQSTGHTPSYQQVIKFDGKVLPRNNNVDTADTTLVSTTTVYIVVPNSDSGWGDAYTPSADEIKAYFNGWKISSNNTASPAPYTGTGNRYWYAVGSTPLDSSWYTAANDINWAVNNPVISVSRYKLMYQLSQSIDEPIAYEGELMLHDGPNQIEMGTGVVVREPAPEPSTSGGFFYISGGSPVSKLRNRALTIFEVYKDGYSDRLWSNEIRENSDAANIQIYGYGRSKISPGDYEPTAAYSVTYLALDTYTLGIAPQSISGTATPNIKETVDDAVQAITGLRRDVSVLQNTKAQKQQPQMIAATLINGATGYGSGYDAAMYYKDDAGKVGFVGLINNVAANSIVLYLPESYRPSNRIILDAIGDNGSNNFVVVRVTIGADGSVLITNPGTTWTSLSSIPMFRAEQ